MAGKVFMRTCYRRHFFLQGLLGRISRRSRGLGFVGDAFDRCPGCSAHRESFGQSLFLHQTAVGIGDGESQHIELLAVVFTPVVGVLESEFPVKSDRCGEDTGLVLDGDAPVNGAGEIQGKLSQGVIQIGIALSGLNFRKGKIFDLDVLCASFGEFGPLFEEGVRQNVVF